MVGSDQATTSTAPQRTKTGCQNCRQRHLRCDENRPSCSRCEKIGIECVRGFNIRFRHGANPSVTEDGAKAGEYDFSDSQTWVNTARNLTFLDETPDLINIYDHEELPQVNNSWQQPDERVTSSNTVLKATEVQDVGMADLSSPGQHSHHSYSAGSNPSPYETSSVVGSVGHGSIEDVSSPSKRRRLEELGRQFSATTPSVTRHDSSDHFHSPVSWHAPSYSELNAAIPHDESPASNALEGLFSPADLSAGYQHTSQPSVLALSSSLSRTFLNTPAWPLHNREEAMLLQHFTQHVARSFDLTDPYCHFRKVVPQRAATCPPLLKAIFALSARHLSKVADYDPLISNRYHQQCLEHLIPMLDDPAVILDENLLASTIILRHLEEFEIPVTGTIVSDQTSHLLGAHAFIAAQGAAAAEGGLRQAAFWTGLRQEIFVAFAYQRAIIPPLDNPCIDRTFEATDDFSWACRSVVLCADTMRYCYGEDDERSNAQYSELVERVARWWETKPATFKPIFQSEPNEEQPFGELIYVTDEHPTGLHYWHLARILLSAHNPQIPRLGPRRAAALKAMDNEIRAHVRAMCAIATSNPTTPPNFVYACMAITMCGDKFHDRKEQEAMIEILVKMERDHAWPTSAAQVNLKEVWGWAET